MAFQTADVVDAITRASGTALAEMRVDGGASVMDLLCQFQADLLGVPVRRAAVQETTALGAAFLAGHRRRRVGLARRGERDVAVPRRRSRRRWTPPSATRRLADVAPRGRALPRLGARLGSRATRPAVSGVRTSSYEATCATSVGMSSAFLVA